MPNAKATIIAEAISFSKKFIKKFNGGRKIIRAKRLPTIDAKTQRGMLKNVCVSFAVAFKRK